MKRILVLITTLLTLALAATAHADVLTTGSLSASGQTVAHSTRVQNFVCPDPSAYDYYYWHRVKQGRRSHVVRTPATYVACTSDFSASVFGIFMSTDRNRDHYTFVTHVYLPNTRPSWSGGRFWAPDLTRIGNKWVVYYAGFDSQIQQWVVGVATTTNLRGNNWQTKIVHSLGDHNSTSATKEPTTNSGAIDPGEAYDPYNGMRYLVWTDQPDTIWIAPLSSDGMSIVGTQVYNVLNSQPMDCDINGCVVEGSAIMFHNGQAVILYSDKSTWDGSYGMRYATNNGQNPLSTFQTYDSYLLQPNSGWYNTGGGQTPVEVNGHLQLLFHGTKQASDPQHISNVRLGLSATFSWNGGTPVLAPIG